MAGVARAHVLGERTWRFEKKRHRGFCNSLIFACQGIFHNEEVVATPRNESDDDEPVRRFQLSHPGVHQKGQLEKPPEASERSPLSSNNLENVLKPGSPDDDFVHVDVSPMPKPGMERRSFPFFQIYINFRSHYFFQCLFGLLRDFMNRKKWKKSYGLLRRQANYICRYVVQ